jgi:ketosteroid isomerase-like protein
MRAHPPIAVSRGTRYCLGVSQENVELVRSVYADPRGLTAGASGRVAPDAEFDFSAVYPDSPIVRGVEELRRFRDSGPWSGSPIHFEPERFFDVDNERVLVFVRVSATGLESGAQVENRVAHEFTIRDELVVRFKVYESRDQALEAAGLRQ